MKTIFSIIAFITLAFCGLAFDFSKDSQHIRNFPAQQTGVIVQSIYDTDGVVRTELRLDTTQYSQCDTCSSNLIDAIRLKRQLTDSLTVQNAKLYDEWTESIALTDTLKRINKMVNVQIISAKVDLKTKGKR